MAFYIKVVILNKYKFKKITMDKILNIEINKLGSLKEQLVEVLYIIITKVFLILLA